MDNAGRETDVARSAYTTSVSHFKLPSNQTPSNDLVERLTLPAIMLVFRGEPRSAFAASTYLSRPEIIERIHGKRRS